MTSDSRHSPALHNRLDLVALTGALGTFVILQLVAAGLAGWVFEYPLDDVYIYLAMASEIARGGYGVNSGEVASAASSGLYPLLLTPFPDSEFQRVLPLFWNVIGLVLTAVLWGRALMWAGYTGALGLGLAFFGPLLAGGVSTAYVGMEHTLHAAASVAVIFGLARYLAEGRATAMLILGLALGPILRFEGLALSGMAVLTLALTGRVRLAALCAALALVPVAAFVWILTWLGLDPLPSSVQAKLATSGEESLSALQRISGTFLINVGKPGGLGILALVVVTAVLRLAAPALRQTRWTWLSATLIAAGLAHLAFGQIGWLERYEHYIIAALGTGVLILAPQAASPRVPAKALAVIAVILAGSFYAKETATFYYWGSRAIHLQQGQMAAFAQDHLDRNVAVNDLGRVVWGNRNYVLDLFGLSNAEARRLRLSDPAPGWGGPLIVAHDIAVIMIYDKANMAGHSVAPEWVKLGKLVMFNAIGYLGAAEVDFYAADDAQVAHATQALRSWVETLPNDACFLFEGMTKCPR